MEHSDLPDVGPFELLQARQLLESSIAEFLGRLQATQKRYFKFKKKYWIERERITTQNQDDYSADKDFHFTLAEITIKWCVSQI